MRDEFDEKAKDILARRVGFRCSNPTCRKLTSGPQSNPLKAINIGVAAHITAASPGGPRYDSCLSQEQRSSVENGIWLCQACAKLIDNDAQRYPVSILLQWKEQSENTALRELECIELSQRSNVDPLDTFLSLLDEPTDWVKIKRDQYIRHRFRPEFVIKEGETVNEDYCEPWAQRFPDPHARSFVVEYWYGSTLLKSSLFVSTDGGRFSVPLPELHEVDPEREDWSSIEFIIDFSSIEWKTAMLFDQYDDLSQRLLRIGIKIVE